MIKMIAIIDYGVGNLFSLKSSLAEIGAEAVVTSDEKVIADCDRIILMDDGKIEAVAPHEELLKISENYRYLNSLQVNGGAVSGAVFLDVT